MKMKDMIGLINVMAGEKSTQKSARGLLAGASRMLTGPRDRIVDAINGINVLALYAEEELEGWSDPEDIPGLTSDAPASRQVVPFDACDLRVWTQLAERAGVPYIPAKPILSLHEDMLGLLSGKIRGVDKQMERLSKRLADQKVDAEPATDASPENTDGLAMIFKPDEFGTGRPLSADGRARLHHEVQNAVFDAMDDVPEGWMVRSHVSGSSTLKALAGAGVLGDPQEGAKISQNVEIGAGWVRVGNRRRIDATDKRFIETFVGGHKPVIHYLARPWQTPSRMIEGEDPHRQGSQFAGKGAWPAEWRVFVENGTVTGVANYYGWCGEADAPSARAALEAADSAQRIVDAAKGLNLAARYMDLMFMTRPLTGKETPESLKIRDAMNARFDVDGINCTLDFMETEDGLKLIEGGPAFSPIGGAHPCAFAGAGIEKGSRWLDCETVGIAFKTMSHVCLGDPKTWIDGDRTGCILSWDEARALAEADQTPTP
jgi:hypothetical protein